MGLTACELSDGYAPDEALRELAYTSRQIFGEQELNTFFYMFGIAHLAFYRDFARDPTARRSLDAFETTGKKDRAMRDSALLIVRICNSFSSPTPEDPFTNGSLMTALRRYETVCKVAFGESAKLWDQKVADGLSQLFQVQVVLLAHTENGLDGTVALLDVPAPVIHLEKIQEIYGCLVLDSTFSHLAILDAATIRKKYQKHLKFLNSPAPAKPRTLSPQPAKNLHDFKRSTTKMPSTGHSEPWANIQSLHGVEVEQDTMSQKLQFLVEKERNLRSLVEIQMSLLSSLTPAVASSSTSLAGNEDFMQTLKSGQQLATYLDIDADILNELESAAKAQRASSISHDWMFCERYCASLISLRCGHKLCAQHVRELKNQCPYSCS